MPIWYLFGEYPVHQGGLNLLQPISLSYESRTSVFTMVVVMIEVPDYVGFLS